MRVLICGGGVIGAACAYFLAERGIEAMVVERTGIANAASGKSGGFLALDWCDGSAAEPLGTAQLRPACRACRPASTTIGDTAGSTPSASLPARAATWASTASSPRPAGWRRSAAVHAKLGTAETTAQVAPAAFTGALMRAAIARGARLTIGTVTGVARAADGTVRGAMVDGQEVAGDAVVIAMGPWSVMASRWLPLPAVYGLKGHSLIFRYAPAPAPCALFVELETEAGTLASPEVFPRPDGTTYVCGLSSEAPLPVDPAAVAPDDNGAARLRAMTAQFAPELGGADVLAEQACYRPVVEDGLPLIGAVPGVAGAYVATGHSVWGMLNGPATGEAIAALIADGESRAVDLSPFDPARLPALDADAVRVVT